MRLSRVTSKLSVAVFLLASVGACNEEASFQSGDLGNQSELEEVNRYGDEDAIAGLPTGPGDDIDGDGIPDGIDDGTGTLDGSDPSGAGGGSNTASNSGSTTTPGGGGTGTNPDGTSGGTGTVGSGGDTTVPGTPIYSELVQRFSTNNSGSVASTVNVGPGIMSTDVLLLNSYADYSKSFTQITRPSATKMHKQGTAGSTGDETFTQQLVTGVLDILVVIDNSGSMKEEQENLATKLKPLLTYIDDSDWRIGVVTTDPNDPCMRAVIQKGDANAESSFANAINAGTDGNGNEQGFRQAVKGLSCSGTDWIRPTSTLAVLIVSDEDNCSSNGEDCVTDPWNKPSYLTNHISSNMSRNLGADARVYGIIWHPNESCSSGYNKSYQYADVIQSTGGTHGNICDADYSQTLVKISEDVSGILKSQFALKNTPDDGTLQITITPAGGTPVLTNDYTLSGNIITFNQPPADGSMIRATYTYGAREVTSTFALDSKPAADTLTVMVNKVLQSPTAYTVNADAQTVTFKQAPVDNADISISYKLDVALTTGFEIGTSAELSSVKTYVNDSLATSGVSYDKANGIVKFSTPPADGASIRIDYKEVEGPILTYSLLLSGQNQYGFEVYDESKNPVESAKISGGVLTIATADHAVNKVLAINYKNDSSGKQEIPLAHTPLDGTFNLAIEGDECTLGDSVIIQQDSILVDCDMDQGIILTFSYDYVGEPKRTFDMSEVSNPDVGQWSVKVDGLEVTDFTRTGTKITVGGSVEVYQDSEVMISYKFQVKNS